MRHRSKLPQVEIPAIVLLIQPGLTNSRNENVVAFFSLTASNDLADPRSQDVHGPDSSSILIQAHVKRLNLLGVIGNDYWLAENLLCEVPFMLTLQVTAPEDREFEGSTILDRCFQNSNRFRVGDVGEIAGGDMFERLKNVIVDALVKELDLAGTVVQKLSNNELQEPHR